MSLPFLLTSAARLLDLAGMTWLARKAPQTPFAEVLLTVMTGLVALDELVREAASVWL